MLAAQSGQQSEQFKGLSAGTLENATRDGMKPWNFQQWAEAHRILKHDKAWFEAHRDAQWANLKAAPHTIAVTPMDLKNEEQMMLYLSKLDLSEEMTDSTGGKFETDPAWKEDAQLFEYLAYLDSKKPPETHSNYGGQRFTWEEAVDPSSIGQKILFTNGSDHYTGKIGAPKSASSLEITDVHFNGGTDIPGTLPPGMQQEFFDAWKSENTRLGTDIVEEKNPQEFFWVFSEMRFLVKINVSILDFCMVCRSFSEILCEIGF